ncbi:hypothetical protein RSAG8_10057, partial [Rhizoctonia solani AG-8 WAC10335]
MALGNTSIYDTTHLPEHRTGIYLGNVKATTSNPSPQTDGDLTFGGSHKDNEVRATNVGIHE